MEIYDATIIGAGLAGLQCARLLGRRGFRVLLVDRKGSLDHRVHTTGIFVRKTLLDFDIPEDCLGPPVRHVSLYSPSHRELSLVSKHDEFRIARMGQLYDRYLSQCLRSGVQWLPATSYLDHSDLNGKLAVRLSTSVPAATPVGTARIRPSTFSVSTGYLIGADGARSRVAQTLGLDQNSEWIVGVEDVFTRVGIEGPPRLCCFLDPELAPGYIAWIAYDGVEAHVGVGGYPALFDPLTALEKFQTSVGDIIDLRNARQIERRGGRIPVGGVLRRIANAHGLLIGDAAGAVSPLTAGGLDPCMRLSTMAANVVAAFLETKNAKAIADYSGDLFRARFTSRLWARRVAGNLRGRRWVELVCGGLRLPLVNKFAGHVFFGRGSFPDVEMGFTRQTCPAEVNSSLL